MIHTTQLKCWVRINGHHLGYVTEGAGQASPFQPAGGSHVIEAANVISTQLQRYPEALPRVYVTFVRRWQWELTGEDVWFLTGRL